MTDSSLSHAALDRAAEKSGQDASTKHIVPIIDTINQPVVPLRILVSEASHDQQKHTHALYDVTLTMPHGKQWSVKRRYSEFLALKEDLDRLQSEAERQLFPKKHPFASSKDPSVVQERLSRLPKWLVAISQHPVLSTQPSFRKFLGLDALEPLLEQEAAMLMGGGGRVEAAVGQPEQPRPSPPTGISSSERAGAAEEEEQEGLGEEEESDNDRLERGVFDASQFRQLDPYVQQQKPHPPLVPRPGPRVAPSTAVAAAGAGTSPAQLRAAEGRMGLHPDSASLRHAHVDAYAGMTALPAARTPPTTVSAAAGAGVPTGGAPGARSEEPGEADEPGSHIETVTLTAPDPYSEGGRISATGAAWAPPSFAEDEVSTAEVAVDLRLPRPTPEEVTSAEARMAQAAASLEDAKRQTMDASRLAASSEVERQEAERGFSYAESDRRTAAQLEGDEQGLRAKAAAATSEATRLSAEAAKKTQEAEVHRKALSDAAKVVTRLHDDAERRVAESRAKAQHAAQLNAAAQAANLAALTKKKEAASEFEAAAAEVSKSEKAIVEASLNEEHRQFGLAVAAKARAKHDIAAAAFQKAVEDADLKAAQLAAHEEAAALAMLSLANAKLEHARARKADFASRAHSAHSEAKRETGEGAKASALLDAHSKAVLLAAEQVKRSQEIVQRAEAQMERARDVLLSASVPMAGTSSGSGATTAGQTPAAAVAAAAAASAPTDKPTGSKQPQVRGQQQHSGGPQKQQAVVTMPIQQFLAPAPAQAQAAPGSGISELLRSVGHSGAGAPTTAEGTGAGSGGSRPGPGARGRAADGK